MSLFIPTIPTSGQNLDFSQGQLLSNNQGLDTVFGVDHYKFSDGTANKGFHNKVTTPLIVGSTHPATGAAPIFYAMQDTAPLGVIQYSRGPNNAVPTPVTYIQSISTGIPLAPSATTNVLDFTGMARGHGTLYIMGHTVAPAIDIAYAFLISWNGSAFAGFPVSTSSPLAMGASLAPVILVPAASGNILQIKNLSPTVSFINVFWTLQLVRTS